jgi:hypothetical protein
MPKPSLKTARRDRGKISMQDEVEVKYWTRHLGITRKRLQSLVEKVGNSAASVRKELSRTQQETVQRGESGVD